MMFQNDLAFRVVLEGCVKGMGGDARMQQAISASVTVQADEDRKREAMGKLLSYLSDEAALGLYYEAMRFLIKGLLYQDDSFDFGLLEQMAEGQEEVARLMPFAREYVDSIRKKGAKNAGEEDFFLKTQSIFSDDFGRFLYGRMKQCGISYDSAITEAQVDEIARSVKKKARPGMFLCLIDYVYGGRTKNMEIFWYTMRKYVLPVLGGVEYTEEKTNEQAIWRSLLNQYAYYIYNVVYLSYMVAREEQGGEDKLEPQAKYWYGDKEKKAIDEAVVRFYEDNEKMLGEVLGSRMLDGMKKMAGELAGQQENSRFS